MPIIVTARETAKEIADCTKKSVVVRGRRRAHAPYPPPGACPEPEHVYSLPGELISSDSQWRDVQLVVHEGA